MKPEDYMKICLRLAGKARGMTNPNPMVGCVIVKEGKIVGQGFHKRAGLAHAEVEALDRAEDKAKGATLYVNLEPCNHYGRTPPCTKAIMEAGIKEVYAAMLDPNPLNNGKGVKELIKKGIKIKVGTLDNEAKKLNEVFIKFITRKIPFVTVKVAETLDGKIATKTGESKWISSEKSREYVKKLRAEVDAVLVGVNTVIKDDPLLNAKRKAQSAKLYYKIILDSRLKIPPQARIFSKKSIGKVILATTKYAARSRVNLFSRKAEVLICKGRNKQVDLRDLMRKLAQKEISHVLIEGGGETIASALGAKIVDRVLFFIAPKIIGGRNAVTSVEGEGNKRLSDVMKLGKIKISKSGEDILIEGVPVYVHRHSGRIR